MGTVSESITMFSWLIILLLLSTPAVRTEPTDVKGTDHGLANEKSTTAASPAMMAFFHGESPATALPVAAAANNATDPLLDWTGNNAAPGEEEESGGGGGGRRRKALMVVGIVFGVVGVGLVGAAVGLYLLQKRRTEVEGKQGELRVLHQLEPL